MTRPFKLEILEDVEYLEKSLRQTRLGSQIELLQMLWWLKSGQVKQQQELGQRLGRDTSTISRWLQHYRRGGLSALLEEKKAPGRAWAIEGDMLVQLETQLQQPTGFKSYGEIVEWFFANVWQSGAVPDGVQNGALSTQGEAEGAPSAQSQAG